MVFLSLPSLLYPHLHDALRLRQNNHHAMFHQPQHQIQRDGISRETPDDKEVQLHYGFYEYIRSYRQSTPQGAGNISQREI